jgi:hypothetical protein
LARAESQTYGQIFQAAAIAEGAGFDPRGRGPGRRTDAIDGRMSRREFRTAPQTGPKSGPLGQCGAREEPAASTAGRFGGANRPAVNAGRLHTDKKQPVKARISRQKGSIANIVIESHPPILAVTRKLTRHFRTCKNGIAMLSDFVATGVVSATRRATSVSWRVLWHLPSAGLRTRRGVANQRFRARFPAVNRYSRSSAVRTCTKLASGALAPHTRVLSSASSHWSKLSDPPTP